MFDVFDHNFFATEFLHHQQFEQSDSTAKSGDTCPTGALIEKKAPKLKPGETETTRTTCNFCGVGCQMDLHVHNDRLVKITSPPPGETMNDGNLCIKGRFAYDFVHHEDRITEPLIRGEDGKLHPATWEKALKFAAAPTMAT